METGETLFFIAGGITWLACGKKREIFKIPEKCYLFMHFPILELTSKGSAGAPSQRIKKGGPEAEGH